MLVFLLLIAFVGRANHIQYQCSLAKDCTHVMGNCQFDTVNLKYQKQWMASHGPLINGANCENFQSPPTQLPFCVSGVCLPGIPPGARDKADFYRKYSQVCSQDADCKLVTTYSSNAVKVVVALNPIFEKEAPLSELKDLGVKYSEKLKSKCLISKTSRSLCSVQ